MIFRITCLHLLSDVVSTESAELMLASDTHHSWVDKGLENVLAAYLGQSREQCIRTLWQIERILEDIEDEREGLNQALDASIKVSQFPAFPMCDLSNNKLWQAVKLKPFSRDWTWHLKEKLGFVFSQTHLAQNFTLLRDFVQDLRDLCSPDIKSLRGDPSTGVIGRNSTKDLELHRSIGDASQEVFESLQKACSKRIEHHAHLCIEVEQVSSRGILTPQFKFKLAFASVSAESEPMWFSIETIMKEIVLNRKAEGEECASNLKRALKRQLAFPEDAPEPADQDKPRKKKTQDSSASARRNTDVSSIIPGS